MTLSGSRAVDRGWPQDVVSGQESHEVAGTVLRVSRRGWLLFGALSVIWGVPYLLDRVAVRQVTPEMLIFMRTAPVALVLLPVTTYRRQLPDILRRWRPLLAYSIVEIGISWLLITRAEERLSSSLTGLLIAAVPLIGALIARVKRDEDRFDRMQVAGLLIGLIGVALLVGVDVHGATALPIAGVLVAAVGYAIGPRVFNRYLSDLPNLGVVAASLAMIAIGYAPFALSNLPGHLSLETVASLAGLALIPTLAGFLVFFRADQRGRAGAYNPYHLRQSGRCPRAGRRPVRSSLSRSASASASRSS